MTGKKTSYGFKHEAELFKNGSFINKAKCTYYNRTWERYEYESVIKEVLCKEFGDEQGKNLLNQIQP